jgi:hypothetical protein
MCLNSAEDAILINSGLKHAAIFATMKGALEQKRTEARFRHLINISAP